MEPLHTRRGLWKLCKNGAVQRNRYCTTSAKGMTSPCFAQHILFVSTGSGMHDYNVDSDPGMPCHTLGEAGDVVDYIG